MLARKLPNQLPEFQEVELSIIVLVQWAHKLVNGSRVISFLQENRKSHVSNIKKEPSQSVDNAKNSVNTGHVYGARDQRQAEHTGMQTSLKKKNHASSAEVVWHRTLLTLSPSSGHCDYYNYSNKKKHVEFSTLWVKQAFILRTCRAQTRQSQQRNTFFLRGGHLVWNIKWRVISCPNMRWCNCSFMVKITGRRAVKWLKTPVRLQLLMRAHIDDD